MANHLEQLASEWLEFKGYFVRHNVNVGKLPHGGYEGELDVVGYHPKEHHLLHIELSIDSHSWKRRNDRFSRKFAAGRKYIITEVFTWLADGHPIEQWAVILGSDTNHKQIGCAMVKPIRKFYKTIAADLQKYGKPDKSAVPEQFPLLRTMQNTIFWVNDSQLRSNFVAN